MIQKYLTPIELEIQRIANRLNSACGSSYQTCDKCGEKGKGFSNLMEGTFTCLKCHLKKEAERLNNDQEWIRKDRVWRLIMARKSKERLLGINTKIAEVHNEKERY